MNHPISQSFLGLFYITSVIGGIPNNEPLPSGNLLQFAIENGHRNS